MRDSGVLPLFEALRSQNPKDGWVEFLNVYSSVLYQTARASTSTEEESSDCYLHICEELAKHNFRRLLKFKPEGKASFTTWLRVVARNLCFDWHRKQHGRPRPFKALQDLSPLEMEIYHHRVLGRSSLEETLARLEPHFPAVTMAQVANIEESLQRSLTPRQHWILSSQNSESRSLVLLGDDEDIRAIDAADPRPNQEARIIQKNQLGKLNKAIRSLPAEEALLLHFRFEQDLSLEEIARLCGLGDAQRVHRKLGLVLRKLRCGMS